VIWSPALLQAEQVKAVALRIAQKYYGEPQRINARWQRRHGALEAPQQLEGEPAGAPDLCMGLLSGLAEARWATKWRHELQSQIHSKAGDTAAGMPQQEMPASTLSMDWRLIWHTQQERPPVTVWRPVRPSSTT
jgi:hypothetical protein